MDEQPLPTITTKGRPTRTTTPLPATPEFLRNSAVTSTRLVRHRQGRFNPIRSLKPERLVSQIEQFEGGTLDPLARSMEAVANRDDTLKAVIGKRIDSVVRMNYEVMIDPAITEEQKAEAESHQKVLKYFYSNLIATNAIDRDQRGGFSLLVAQMMTAVLYKYAAHELLWNPVPSEGLRCTFNFVPLYFFENKSGQMRFLESEGAIDGVDLEENAWMVTCGPCLMLPSIVAWMYKSLSLKDWVLYSEKYGAPGILIKTGAQKGNTQWDAAVEAVEQITAGFGGVANIDDELQVVNFQASGEMPQSKLVERMDRALAILWRGGDLSTISKDTSAVGSNPQQEDGDAIEEADARLITETLNERIDKLVISYHFGRDIKPLAFVKVCPGKKQDIAQELAIDAFFLKNRMPLLRKDLYERYGRTMPPEGASEKDVVVAPEPEEQPATARFGANERMGLNRGEQQHVALLRNARARAADAEAVALEPLWQRLDGLIEILDGHDAKAAEMALRKFLEDLPELQRQIASSPAGARAFEAIASAGLFNGLTEAHVSRN